MNTPLRSAMSPEQLATLVSHVADRCGELYGNLQASRYWRSHEKFEKRAAGDYDSRKQAADADPRELSIFDQRNASLRPVATVNSFLEARMCRDMFGSTPWFSVRPQGKLDEVLVKQIEPHSRYKLRECKFSSQAKQAIRTALDLGDCPVKVTWEVQTDESEELRVVLVDTRTGEPVVNGDGGMIEPEEEDSEVEVPDESQPPTIGEDGAEMPMMRKARMFASGVEFVPGVHEFREMIVPKTVRTYAGLRIEPIDWRAVIFPIDAPSFQAADLIAVRSNVRLSELRRRFQGKKRAEGEPVPPGELPWSEEIEAALKQLESGNQHPEGDHGQPRVELGEAQGIGPRGDPMVNVTEAYGEFDALGDGVMRRFWMVLVEDKKVCLWVDYLTALSPWARKPVFMLAIHRPRNRAYGLGHYELFEMLEDLTDEQLNCILVTNEWVANPPKVVNRKKLVASQQDPADEMHPGKELNPGDSQVTARDIIEVVQWPDKSSRAWELMQLPMQIIQAWSGVTNAAQAAVSELPGNDLATGINALAEVASVLHVHLLEQLKDGTEDVVRCALETLYLRQDTDETYEFLEGEAEQVLSLTSAERLRRLPLNVEITLTRAKRQEEREAALAAVPQMIQYGQLPSTEQERLNPMFEQLLAGLGFAHPARFLSTHDEILQKLVGELQTLGWVVMPPQAAPPPSSEGPAEPPTPGGMAA